jgi:hypothetical protein
VGEGGKPISGDATDRQARIVRRMGRNEIVGYAIAEAGGRELTFL